MAVYFAYAPHRGVQPHELSMEAGPNLARPERLLSPRSKGQQTDTYPVGAVVEELPTGNFKVRYHFQGVPQAWPDSQPSAHMLVWRRNADQAPPLVTDPPDEVFTCGPYGGVVRERREKPRDATEEQTFQPKARTGAKLRECSHLGEPEVGAMFRQMVAWLRGQQAHAERLALEGQVADLWAACELLSGVEMTVTGVVEGDPYFEGGIGPVRRVLSRVDYLAACAGRTLNASEWLAHLDMPPTATTTTDQEETNDGDADD